MIITGIDFETFYSREYSLRRMTPFQYIQHPLFACHGAAVRYTRHGLSGWLGPEHLPIFFNKLQEYQDRGETVLMVSHNALFDMCIAAWVYNYTPTLMVDTLALARATYGHVLKSLSLDSVARHLGIGGKIQGVLPNVMGMDLATIKQVGMFDQYKAYGIQDLDLAMAIFDRIVVEEKFPMRELVVMDMVTRACTSPVFKLNENVLHTHLNEVLRQKQEMIDRVEANGINSRDLASNEKFAQMLRTLGIIPPMKTSPATGKPTYAFSKSDKAFLDLQDHPDPEVQALVAARLKTKSTIEETRTRRFITVAETEWLKPYTFKTPWGAVTHAGKARAMPMPLHYSAAHTHRLGGGWKYNVQNLGRRSKLRIALEAEIGYKVVAGDLAQIEARLAGWFCGADSLTKQFAAGDDVYSNFASEVFGFKVNKKDHPIERFVGKQGVLGLGYGLGRVNFHQRVLIDSRNQLGQEIDFTIEQSSATVSTYRNLYHPIPDMWSRLNGPGVEALLGAGPELHIHPIVIRKGEIVLPNGMKLFYHNLRRLESGDLVFDYGRERKYIWGGKLLENIIQALARIIIMEAAIRLRPVLGGFALQAHDELVYVVPDDVVEGIASTIKTELKRGVDWCKGAPLDAEVNYGQSYADCK